MRLSSLRHARARAWYCREEIIASPESREVKVRVFAFLKELDNGITRAERCAWDSNGLFSRELDVGEREDVCVEGAF